MFFRALIRTLACCLVVVVSRSAFGEGQDPSDHAAQSGGTLQYVVYLSRHGVRSPTGPPAQYRPYSDAPWPQWDVPPGYLTAHGYKLMSIFGKYDRAELAARGLLSSEGCADATRVTILADSDQRTRETGKAVAEGMFPGCNIEVHALPEKTPDPLFHSLHAGMGHVDPALAQAALAGRLSGDPNNLTEAYRSQLSSLDRILGGCGKVPAGDQPRIPLLGIPSSLGAGKGDHPIQLRGPLSTASSLSENLLLEYAEGFTGTNLGWGCLEENGLREVMELHTAAADFEQRTPIIARMYASNLLDHILKSIEQSAAGKPIPGALGNPDDRVLFLSGHDTNISTVAGLLRLTWIIDGRRDDTPPGGSLVFELWRVPKSDQFHVYLFYTAQTLQEMRTEQPLSIDHPPQRLPVFVPRCSQSDQSCTLVDFTTAVNDAIDPAFVRTQPE